MTDTFFESQMMFVCDQISYKILDINRAAVEKLGLNREKLLNKTLHDLGNPVSLDIDPGILAAHGVESSSEIWVLTGSRDKIYVQFSSHMIRFREDPAKVIVAHDITPVLQQTGKGEHQLSSPVGFHDFPLAEIEWDKKKRVLRWSEKAEQIFGYTQQEAINDPMIYEKIVHPEDQSFVEEEIMKCVQRRSPISKIMNRNVTRSGKTVHCEWYNSFLYDHEGQVVSTYSLITDVSERVKVMDEHEKSVRSFQDLFDSISDAIYLVNDEGRILIANEGMKDTFGYAPRKLIGKDQQFLRAPGKFDPGFMFHLRTKEQGREQVKVEGWGKKANGEVFPTEMLINRGSYFGDDVWIFIERDITDRKDAEEELKKRELLFSELFETSPLGIILLNSHNEVMQVNQGFTHIFDYEDFEIRGLEIDRVIVPESEQDNARILTNTERVAEIECQRLSKSGELKDVLIYAVPIKIENRTIAKYGIYVDITDRKHSEKRLLESLKEKEVLLAEIHHRVKNNLAVITGLLELQSYSTDNEEAQEVLVESQMRVNSIALVHETLYQNENLSEINIENYLHKLSHILDMTIRKESRPVHIHYDLEDITLAVTQAVPCGLLLNEILTNCYKHAFKGMETGKVWISFKQKDEYLEFHIRDNGVGLPSGDMLMKSKSLGMKLIKTLSRQLG
ncbi:MAG TPA: PAS domain S-box protein, partial [Balneolaceae bacterium]|nr:PAS domain S-box protein [Balneolaceae bacterium]